MLVDPKSFTFRWSGAFCAAAGGVIQFLCLIAVGFREFGVYWVSNFLSAAAAGMLLFLAAWLVSRSDHAARRVLVVILVGLTGFGVYFFDARPYFSEGYSGIAILYIFSWLYLFSLQLSFVVGVAVAIFHLKWKSAEFFTCAVICACAVLVAPYIGLGVVRGGSFLLLGTR